LNERLGGLHSGGEAVSLRVIPAHQVVFGGLLERDPGRWMAALAEQFGDFPHRFTAVEQSAAGNALDAHRQVDAFIRECIWPQVMGRLSQAIPGSEYAAWFQGAVFPVGLFGSTFLISAINASACSRIEEHYLERLSAIVSGMLGGQVSVQIVEEASLAEKTPHQLIDRTEESRGAGENGGFLLEALIDRKTLDKGLYEAIVRPDRVVAIPKTYLGFLPYLGPARMSIVVAFRQVLYLRENGDLKGSDGLVEVSYDELASWAGMSRIAVVRNLKKLDNGLEWFIEKVPYRDDEVSCYYDEEQGVTRQRPLRYRFRIKPPVPVGDAIAIEDYLLAAGIRTDPAAALQRALDEKIGNILPAPASTPPKNWHKLDAAALTLTDIVKPLCGIQNYTREIAERVHDLEERLFPRDQVVMVSWYSVREWAPRVSPGIFWAYVLFKSHTFYNRVTGESRPVAELKDGFDPSASVLGVKAKTMREWFLSDTVDSEGVCDADFIFSDDPKERARQLAQKSRLESAHHAQQLVHASVTGTHGRKITRINVRVAERIPLTPEHAVEKERLLAFGEVYVQVSAQARASIWEYLCKAEPEELQRGGHAVGLSSADDIHALNLLSADDTHTATESAADDMHASEATAADDIRASGLWSADDTPAGRESAAGDTLDPPLSVADDTRNGPQMIPFKLPAFKLPKKIILDYLNYLQDSLDEQAAGTSPKEMDAGAGKKPVVVDRQEYDLSGIIYRLTKNRKTTRELLANEPAPQAVISTLLYMASPQGETLKDAYFVARLRENPQEIYSFEFGKMAAWAPRVVLDHLAHSLASWESDFTPDALWSEAMKGANPIRLQKLYYWLTGEVL
jgi:hypothetical protein